MTEGINGLYQARKKRSQNRKRHHGYKSVVNNSMLTNKALKARASFGLGHAYESLGKLKEATDVTRAPSN